MVAGVPGMQVLALYCHSCHRLTHHARADPGAAESSAATQAIPACPLCHSTLVERVNDLQQLLALQAEEEQEQQQQQHDDGNAAASQHADAPQTSDVVSTTSFDAMPQVTAAVVVQGGSPAEGSVQAFVPQPLDFAAAMNNALQFATTVQVTVAMNDEPEPHRGLPNSCDDFTPDEVLDMLVQIPEAGEGERGASDATCAICLEPLPQKPAVRLYCTHAFHRECLKAWFARDSFICPMCRQGAIHE